MGVILMLGTIETKPEQLKSTTLDELIEKIDSLHQMHLSTRGILQYIGEDKVGKSELNWGTKTNSGWIDISFCFRSPISNDSRQELNRFSEFMNQNFIVRLHSLLNYEEIKGGKTSIDESIAGHEMIELIHFLRKQYAHRHGDFDPSDPDSVQLRKRLFEKFNINPEESLPTQFPLDKNRVIKPIVEGTKTYVRGFWQKNRENGT